MDKGPNSVSSEYLKISRDFLSRLRKENIPVRSAFLFGSRIKGTANKWSDLDICVISEVFGRDRQAERVLLLNLRSNISDLIEPHPYSPDDFENRFDPLAREIKATGIKIT